MNSRRQHLHFRFSMTAFPQRGRLVRSCPIGRRAILRAGRSIYSRNSSGHVPRSALLRPASPGYVVPQSTQRFVLALVGSRRKASALAMRGAPSEIAVPLSAEHGQRLALPIPPQIAALRPLEAGLELLACSQFRRQLSGFSRFVAHFPISWGEVSQASIPHLSRPIRTPRPAR